MNDITVTAAKIAGNAHPETDIQTLTLVKAVITAVLIVPREYVLISTVNAVFHPSIDWFAMDW